MTLLWAENVKTVADAFTSSIKSVRIRSPTSGNRVHVVSPLWLYRARMSMGWSGSGTIDWPEVECTDRALAFMSLPIASCCIHHCHAGCVCALQWKDADAEAWKDLGSSAAQGLLQAGAGVAYIGPVLALFGFAVKQWSTYNQVPNEAKQLLRRCMALIDDIYDAWDDLSVEPQFKPRADQWLSRIGAAAAACIVVTERGLITG